MGMRICKVLGYGLTDVVTSNGQITDPRINPSSHLLTGAGRPAVDYTAFLDSIATETGDEDARIESSLLSMLSERDVDARSVCTWNGEYGAPHVLVVRPVGFSQWHRYADPIDTEEEAARHGGGPRVVALEGGIYPFSGLYMDARTGQSFTGTLASTWKRVSLSDPDTKGRAEVLNRLAQALGFQDHANAEQHVVPLVPLEIRRVCSWGELLTNPDVWRQLRPLLYVYWA